MNNIYVNNDGEVFIFEENGKAETEFIDIKYINALLKYLKQKGNALLKFELNEKKYDAPRMQFRGEYFFVIILSSDVNSFLQDVNPSIFKDKLDIINENRNVINKLIVPVQWFDYITWKTR